MKRIVLVAAFIFSASLACAESPHNLFCAAGRIEVDQRDWKTMKTLRGQDVCNFGEFNTRDDALRRATLFGGEGAKCKCK